MNRCWTCQRLLTDHRHYKTCVSKKNWPADLLKPKTETVEESRQISDSSANICTDCGFEAKSTFGLSAHKRKHTAVLSD